MLVLLLSSAWALPALPVPVVHGDFDNDGYTDAAQGFPDASDGAGRVDVFWGNPAARVAWPTVLSPVVEPSSMMSAGAFGASLAVGDFDGDGIDDLAVGAPDADPTWLKGSTTNAGAVTVLYGCAVTCASIDADGAGLPAVGSALDPSAGAQRVFQHAPWGAAVAGMALGSAVAAGDFDGDGFDDLAAGAPGDTVGGDADAGSVVVVYGGPSGVDTSTWQKLQQDLLPPGDTIAEPGDAFGTAVVAARVDGDARDDLVVGAPYEDYTVSGVDQTDAGEIDVFWGDALGLSGSNYDRFRHASATVGGSRQHDHLGIALSAIDAWWLFTGTVFGQLDEAASCGGDPAFLTIPGGAIGDPAPAVVLNCEPDVCDAGYAAGDGELEPLPLRVLVIANAATVAAADLPTLPSATWAGVDPITGEALSGTD